MGTQAEEAVRAIDETFGRDDGSRVVHAKGVLCRGTLTDFAEQHTRGKVVITV